MPWVRGWNNHSIQAVEQTRTVNYHCRRLFAIIQKQWKTALHMFLFLVVLNNDLDLLYYLGNDPKNLKTTWITKIMTRSPGVIKKTSILQIFQGKRISKQKFSLSFSISADVSKKLSIIFSENSCKCKLQYVTKTFADFCAKTPSVT